MLLASLVSAGAECNNVFSQTDPSNRDDCLRFYRMLRNDFAKKSIELNTTDENRSHGCQVELHIDARQPPAIGNAYLVLFETSIVYPPNGDIRRFDGFRKIFTWDDDLIEANSRRFIKANYPSNLMANPLDGFAHRNRLCCMIAGNKTVTVHDQRELYSERINTIRWFERNAPSDFDLFGVGWNAPARRQVLSRRIVHKLCTAFLPPNSQLFSPSYNGAVKTKAETYAGYRFAICYENVRDLRGYITEKIFDAMCAGCVPVYWGAANVTDYISADCFIDRRQFSSHEALHAFMKGMAEKDYLRYQEAMRAFLSGAQARPFSAEAFAETVVGGVVGDLREQGIAF